MYLKINLFLIQDRGGRTLKETITLLLIVNSFNMFNGRSYKIVFMIILVVDVLLKQTAF